MRFTISGILLLIGASGCLLNAATVSYTGSFSNDNSVALLSITLATSSNVTFRTYSYAGGVNGAGTTISNGGFDPLVDVFDASGALIAENDDGGNLVPADPVTLQNFDVYLQTTLTPGSYTVALAQYDNFANGPNLSDGFFETSPNFTSAFGCTNGVFCDVTGANRTNNWALDISGVPSSTATPEPAVTGLFALGLSMFGLARGRKLLGKS